MDIELTELKRVQAAFETLNKENTDLKRLYSEALSASSSEKLEKEVQGKVVEQLNARTREFAEKEAQLNTLVCESSRISCFWF